MLCNQMERIEQRKAQEKKEKRSKDKKPDKVIDVAPDISKTSKPVSGSKPKSSYFFYLGENRDEFVSIVDKENGGKLKGLALSQAANKYGAQAWSNLSDDEKQIWKDKAIDDWKKNGGQEKAKLEEKRQRANGLKDTIDDKENTQLGNSSDVIVEQKEISFADAEAEGLSAMEQRIQQLAQSLSRVGRVLDRHRESEYRKIKGTSVNSQLLRSLVPSPLKIMSDEEVVNWMWNDKTGVVHNLFAMVNRHFPKKSLLQKLLAKTRASYPVLSAFTSFSDEKMHPSVEAKKGRNACSSEDARALVREALLEFRSDINDFLVFAETSHFDAIRKKKNEAARRRDEEKKAKKNTKPNQNEEKSANGGEETVCSDVTSDSKVAETAIPQHVAGSQPEPDSERVLDEMSVDDSHVSSDDVMRIRGGGENILCTESNPPENTITLSDNNGSSLLQDGISKPNVGALSENLSNSQAQHITLPAITHAAPAQGLSSETATSSNDAFPVKLDTQPEFNSDNNKSLITPSSTVSRAETKSVKQTTALPLPAMTVKDHSMENQHIRADDGNQVQTNIQSSSIDALALMASLAAAAPPVTEPISSLASEPNPEIIAPTQSASDSVLPPIVAIDQESSQPEQEHKKKKPVPMNQDQLTYLKNWLLDPNHILNPYPTEAEKTKIMNDIGVDQNHLERWLSRNRKTIILSPEKQSVTMKWEEADSSHWAKFRLRRYMLEATADLLLMYANTNTFFLLEPFNRFDSTPIEVYARELGNEVPRHLAAGAKKTEVNNVGVEQDQSPSKDPAALCSTSMKSTSNSEDTQEYCSPEDVITSVTVSYSEEYVISQLLQWFNGGIGQPQGLPDIFGCVMLPPVSGCWEEIQVASETKVSTYTRATDYSSQIRLRLADWIDDRTKRGSPWNEELARYFCEAGSSPDPSMPLGSPVIDYLVTGIEENIQFVSSALRDKDGKGIDSPARSRSKASASDRLQSTVDAGMPAQAVANWVQCENPTCLKWRKLPWHVDIDLLPEKFYCKDNIWTTGKRSCDVPEDQWDMSDAPVKFDTVEEDFAVGGK